MSTYRDAPPTPRPGAGCGGVHFERESILWTKSKQKSGGCPNSLRTTEKGMMPNWISKLPSVGKVKHANRNYLGFQALAQRFINPMFPQLPPGRVTRLGEFSPIGLLFTLGQFVKNYRNRQNFGLFAQKKMCTYVVILRKNATFWALFSQTHLVTLPLGHLNLPPKTILLVLDTPVPRSTSVKCWKLGTHYPDSKVYPNLFDWRWCQPALDPKRFWQGL
jgi:hypothetical protein